jgi:hypothetical protein
MHGMLSLQQQQQKQAAAAAAEACNASWISSAGGNNAMYMLGQYWCAHPACIASIANFTTVWPLLLRPTT